MPAPAAARRQWATHQATASGNSFTSKERDVETGLDYFGARYYAGTQGRLATLGEQVPAGGKNGYNKQKLTIIGTVIAYERTPLQVIDLSFVPNIEVMYVRIDKRLNGQEPSPYIRVVYEHGTDEPSLLQEVSNSKVQWRFMLKRDGRCDSSLGEIKAAKSPTKEGEELTLPRLKFTSETKGLTDDTKLPCYALKLGNYRAQK